jgi:N-acetylneuraminate synthase
MTQGYPLIDEVDNPYCYVIAESGVNHNGDLMLAHDLVSAAVKAGADAVKFQTFKSENLATETARRAGYQISNLGEDGSQIEMLRALELSPEAHFALKDQCKSQGIDFMSSPFDTESLEFLVGPLGLKRIKIPSGEITNGPFLLDIARTNRSVILSTGMATMDEISVALGVLAHGFLGLKTPSSGEDFASILSREDTKAVLRKNVAILHCTTEYPALPETLNLRAIDTLRNIFGLVTGFSDHSEGISVPIAAVARGAKIIEKHMTLDKSMAGPDHKASLNPTEFSAMVKGIRTVSSAMGDGRKMPKDVELKNRPIARKALVAACPISSGDVFEDNNLAAKRVGGGMSPMLHWSLVGTVASRDYDANEMIDE